MDQKYFDIKKEENDLSEWYASNNTDILVYYLFKFKTTKFNWKFSLTLLFKSQLSPLKKVS